MQSSRVACRLVCLHQCVSPHCKPLSDLDAIRSLLHTASPPVRDLHSLFHQPMLPLPCQNRRHKPRRTGIAPTASDTRSHQWLTHVSAHLTKSVVLCYTQPPPLSNSSPSPKNPRRSRSTSNEYQTENRHPRQRQIQPLRRRGSAAMPRVRLQI